MISSALLEEAILFAVKKHKGETRKGDGRPYIMHSIEVMTSLYGFKKSKNMFLLAAVAVLHDVKENCGVSTKKITKKFGLQVSTLLEELTTNKDLCEKLGKAKYLAQKMILMSSYALLLKLIDRLKNVEDLEEVSPEFKNKYITETIYIVSEVETKRTKLTKTHKAIIAKIKRKLKSYENK